jgi:hypothetical protein
MSCPQASFLDKSTAITDSFYLRTTFVRPARYSAASLLRAAFEENLFESRKE